MSWETYKPHIYDKWRRYWYDTHPHDIAEYSWNYLFTGGKEIRARLFCELWHHLSPDSKVCAELAFAIECIHAASLILDDTPWMDNAMERRGKTTLHLIFSQKKALLLSHDVMYMSYLIWNENRPVHISIFDWENFMKDKLQRLMIGQWYDLEKTGRLLDLASLKTGVLFELVTETVAVCIQLDRDFWKIWGNHLGILFQWMDDWRDREEDIASHSRNAFNEAYDVTLLHYERVWRKIESGIGNSWFQLPFGQFMKTYFTQDIPLSASSHSSTLSDLFLPYPTSRLPYLQQILPELQSDEKRFLEIIRNQDHIITINDKDLFQFEKDDIRDILYHKTRISVKLDGKPMGEMNVQDVMFVDIIDILNLLNDYQQIKLNGKKLIRTMLKLSNRAHPYKDEIFAKYQSIYDRIKFRLWNIQEEEWELQSEIIDSIYDEIQAMKERRGLAYTIISD